MALLIYIAQVSLYAVIMWGIYRIVWYNRPLHRCSRAYLIASLVLPAILPLIELPSGRESPVIYSALLPEVRIAAARSMDSASGMTTGLLPGLLYAGGCALMAALYAATYIRIQRKLRQGVAVPYDDHTLITRAGIGPGTLGRHIFFPADQVDPVILKHEIAHIRAGHRIDAAVLQLSHILFWISPAHWLLGKELKTVQEFEADRIATEGIDPADYASLLLSQGFGAPQTFSIAHSFFHHPLKRRIMMLQKTRSQNGGRLLLTAAALTAAFMSTVLIVQARNENKRSVSVKQDHPPAVIDMEVVKRNAVPPSGLVSTLPDGTMAFKKVDRMPQFNGSMRDWLRTHINYPKNAPAALLPKSSFIQFTVDANGQVVNPQLKTPSGDPLQDAEALRVIREMPAWIPGAQNGQPVPVMVTIPISFNPEMGGDGC